MSTKDASAIITGVNGFVGYHLAKSLNESGVRTIGIGREKRPNERVSPFLDEYIVADLADEWPATNAVDYIFHLAGLAAVGPSFDNPQRYININSGILTNLCEFQLRTSANPRIIAVSSGAVYDATKPMPINEDSALSFNSPYAVSKVLTENQCAYYRQRGLDCVVARPFNHIGPGQSKGFILPDLYQRLTESNHVSSIIVGNIQTKRDYTDVRDIARAYIMLAEAEKLNHTTYNICSGSSLAGSEILELLKGKLNKLDVIVKLDKSLVRPNDIIDIRGDSSRIKEELGWTTNYSIGETIQDFVDYAKSAEQTT